MMDELMQLVKLQEVDDEIRALESRLAKIPKEIEALEKEIATERKNLKDAQDALAAAHKAQRAAEVRLSAAEEKLSKYKDQLMNVKTNDEYRAMQKQIDATREEVSRIEDEILHGLDTVESLEKKQSERQSELQRGQTEIAGMERELEAEKARLDAELAARKSSREEVVGRISVELLRDYQKIAKARGGVAVAEALDEHCQACRVRLRPQVFQELRMGEKIHYCGSCQRILYYQEKEQPAAT